MNLFQAIKAALTSAVSSLTSDRAEVDASDLALFDALREAENRPALERHYALKAELGDARRRFRRLRSLVRNSAPALFDATEAALKDAEAERKRLSAELKAAEAAALKAEREASPRIERVATRHAAMVARVKELAAAADAREAAASARFSAAVANGTDADYDLKADRTESEQARASLAFEQRAAESLGRDLASRRAAAAAAEDAAAAQIGELRRKLHAVEAEAGALEWDRAASALMLAGLRVGDALPAGRLAVPVFDLSRVIGGDAVPDSVRMLDDDTIEHLNACASAGTWAAWRAEAAELLEKARQAGEAHAVPAQG